MIGNLEEASKILGKYKHFKQIIFCGDAPCLASDRASNHPEERESDITPFPITNRLCSIFPSILVADFELRLSFCLPKILPPETDLRV